ncbi:hypothetical protein GIB67_029386 [Kingdonia uniflora]|uniref:FAR1 domain-containing protein n=1 Tax=Kingdonia uniflora TaxID=39325 RepID=A0A7J7NYH3_9MAGN|nr:hypothetical protein GIB67_029386 [Kingdonia uniflora]
MGDNNKQQPGVETCDDNVIDEVADVGSHDQHINVDLSQFNNIVYEWMLYDSEEDAFKKYNEFARKMGCVVRKDKLYKRADESIRSRMFVCFKQGYRKEDKRCKNTTKVRNESRTNCKDRMIIKNENDEWTISKIVYEHNHVLATPSKAYMRDYNSSSSKKIDDEEKDTMKLTKEVSSDKALLLSCDDINESWIVDSGTSFYATADVSFQTNIVIGDFGAIFLTDSSARNITG